MINEAKKGFSFEYKGKSYFIEKDNYKGKQLNDGQNYTIYINLNDPEVMQEDMKQAWQMIGTVVALLTFSLLFNILERIGQAVCVAN
jgi:cell division septal protein FtsQ